MQGPSWTRCLRWPAPSPSGRMSNMHWTLVKKILANLFIFLDAFYLSMPQLVIKQLEHILNAMKNLTEHHDDNPMEKEELASQHILTHNLRHKCEVCGKTFSRPWLLQGHMISHTGKKLYGCAHCGKKSADRSKLRTLRLWSSLDRTNNRIQLPDNNFTLAKGAFAGLKQSLKNLNMKGYQLKEIHGDLAFLVLVQNSIRDPGRASLTGLASPTALNLERNVIQLHIITHTSARFVTKLSPGPGFCRDT